MIDLLKIIDTRLFLLINGHHCSLFAISFSIGPVINGHGFRFIFSLLLLFIKIPEEFWKIIIAVGVLILATDQFSVLIKDHVMRYRPCHNLILQSQIHLVNGECGGQYGFISSHAANSSGLVLFLILLLGRKIKWMIPILLIWCFIVSYSRIYLGTHYPIDVFGGWLCGSLSAIIIFYFYEKFLIQKKNKA